VCLNTGRGQPYSVSLYYVAVERKKVASLERAVLIALCARPELADWPSIHARLAPRAWQDPDHAAIFEAIVRVEGRCLINWREYVPAQLTRMGFPDIDWTGFFAEKPSETLSELLAALDAATAQVAES
jgi:hypothetical protein